MRSGPDPTAELIEATAALQDLACQIAPAEGPGDRATRLTELIALQAGLDTGIDVAVNGPYLVTNADNLHNWLGEDVPTRPQMALCRCGASAIKPLCDGSHATSGFTDARTPTAFPTAATPTSASRSPSRQPRHLPALRSVHRPAGHGVPRRHGAVRAPSGGRMDEIIRAVRDCPSGALSYAIDGVEAREEVDSRHREPAIEVTRDGPYRITGGIPVREPTDERIAERPGASQEHYALCRCGQSQNKPFCSGMHWYVNFDDPVPDPDREPTMFEWAGGLPALTRMTRLFYEKYVPQDPLLAPLFANMSADHPERVAWLGEVFWRAARLQQEYGGYTAMISQHLGKGLTEEQRARWVKLLLPLGPRGRPARTTPSSAPHSASYIEWGSRLAVENSQTDVPAAREHADAPLGLEHGAGRRLPDLGARPRPRRNRNRSCCLADEAVAFDQHIKTLFRERDRSRCGSRSTCGPTRRQGPRRGDPRRGRQRDDAVRRGLAPGAGRALRAMVPVRADGKP